MADIRSPAVAGMFYPAQPRILRDDIQRLLGSAEAADLAPVRAILVPHAGYVYSAPVAAAAYRLFARAQRPPTRLLLMGPSHRSWFQGVAIADVEGFRTPLGVQAAISTPYRLAAIGPPLRYSQHHTKPSTASKYRSPLSRSFCRRPDRPNPVW